MGKTKINNKGVTVKFIKNHGGREKYITIKYKQIMEIKG